MRELLGKNNITLYSAENEEKSSVCEDGTVQLKPKCGSSSLSRVILSILVYYQKYWIGKITRNTVPLK